MAEKQNHSKTFTVPQKLKQNFFDEGYHSGESVNISLEPGKTFASNYKERRMDKKVQKPKSLSPNNRQNKLEELLGKNQVDSNVIDFSKDDPEDDFSKVLNN
jgi:hypothetical protein